MAGKRSMNADQWREAEALAIQGAKYEEISRLFPVSVVTLRQRARDEDWETPGRVAWKQRMATRGAVVAAPETLTKATGGKITSAALVPHLEALRAAAGVDPQAFQLALANCAEVPIAEGAPSIPPPRSVGELAKVYELSRKASGLDGSHSGGDRRFPRSFRSLRRGPVVVEVVPVPADPLEGFEIRGWKGQGAGRLLHLEVLSLQVGSHGGPGGGVGGSGKQEPPPVFWRG